MQLISDRQATQLPPCVATIGFFDGVHRGHKYLIEQVRKIAAEKGAASMAITFPVHPRKVLQPTYQQELLNTTAEKTEHIADTEIDYCVMIDFTPEVAALSAELFMKKVLKEELNVAILIIGYDHRFGKDRTGTFDDYVRYGKALGIEVVRSEECRVGETCVSSSAIRSLLHRAELTMANSFLGYSYYIQGVVTNGYQVGRKIGYPTANIAVGDPNKIIPAEGVYAVKVIVDGQCYRGMLNIGNRPTMANGTNRSIEVHILDFKGDIYDEEIRVELIDYIRKEHKFGDLDQLIAQLNKDETKVREMLTL